MTKWIWLMLSLSSNQTIKVHFLSLFPKNYSLEPVKYSPHAQYYMMLFLLRYAVWTIALWAQGSSRATWRLGSVLVRQKYVIATLSAVFVSRLRRYVKKSQKRWIKESSMQPRKLHDFLSEIMSYKLKQLDDISLRRIKILFSGWSESLPYIEKSIEVFIFRIIWIALSISQIQGVYEEILSQLKPYYIWANHLQDKVIVTFSPRCLSLFKCADT